MHLYFFVDLIFFVVENWTFKIMYCCDSDNQTLSCPQDLLLLLFLFLLLLLLFVYSFVCDFPGLILLSLCSLSCVAIEVSANDQKRFS